MTAAQRLPLQSHRAEALPGRPAGAELVTAGAGGTHGPWGVAGGAPSHATRMVSPAAASARRAGGGRGGDSESAPRGSDSGIVGGVVPGEGHPARGGPPAGQVVVADVAVAITPHRTHGGGVLTV